MRKIFLVLAFMLLVVITGCSKKEASTKSTESTVPMESTEYDEKVQPVEVAIKVNTKITKKGKIIFTNLGKKYYTELSKFSILLNISFSL